MKRIISAVLCIVLAAMTVNWTHLTAFADEAQNNTATRGVYWFDPHEVGDDLTDAFIFDEIKKKGNLMYQLLTASFK